MELDFNKLNAYIKILTDNYKIKLNELDKHPDIIESYKNINNITNDKSFSNNKEDIIKLISKQYRPTQIMPDTVGSFLFGCFQKTYGDIPAECSPLCNYSINGGDGVSMERCDSQIHIQYLDDEENQRFVKLGKSKSYQGYIFVKLNFLGFTSYEKEYFKNEGLHQIQILVTKDSKHHTVLRMKNIDEIPIIEKIDGKFYINSSSAMNTEDSFKETNINTTNNDNPIVYITLAIIILGLMLSLSNNK